MISKNEFRNILKPLPEEEFKARVIAFLKRQGAYENPDGTWSSDRTVDLSYRQLTKLPVQFKEVDGEFFCHDNYLTTLEGSPEKVSGRFICSYNKLITLEGAPREVGGSFHCHNNPVPEEKLKKTVKRDYLK